MVFAVITAVYFLLSLHILDLIFRQAGPHILLDILSVVCVIAAFVLSAALADLSEKKLRAHYKRSGV